MIFLSAGGLPLSSRFHLVRPAVSCPVAAPLCNLCFQAGSAIVKRLCALLLYRDPRAVRSGDRAGVNAPTAAIYNRPLPNPALSLFFVGIAETSDRYSRFCALPNSRRLVKATFKPGTFATTGHDADCANNGAATVGRYALLYLAPAVFRTDFSVKQKVALRYGTALPAFFQAGGGSEAWFQDPAPIVAPKKTAHSRNLIRVLRLAHSKN
jgi:hypothetical protein